MRFRLNPRSLCLSGPPARNFSVAHERVAVTSKRRQCSCRTCRTALRCDDRAGIEVSSPSKESFESSRQLWINRPMVFLERSHIRSAVLVGQFPCQGTPHEARELAFTDLCADGCDQRSRHAHRNCFRRTSEASEWVVVCAGKRGLVAWAFQVRALEPANLSGPSRPTRRR
jgi:hypothetical protein